MEQQQEVYFNALSVSRSESAKALEGFALRGVKNSVVEKYSDQAHFIYELLQNADDAKATSARFELFKDKLIFVHNGTRRFTVSDPATEAQDLENRVLGDINSITAVGGSNKTDEATIGKFGVGFKAVFQYTATPQIYDPNIFFKIERFIVPICLEADYDGRKNGETLFVFPFDHEKRSVEDAYSDISEKLRSLDYPLLFLSNLKDISFEISGILGLYGKTVEEIHNIDNTIAEFVSLTQNDGENRDDLYDDKLWLFSRDNDKGHTYSVGFFVDAQGHLMPKTHYAFCFFPTKEVTGLNFILHAPFLLTDSREGIRAGVQHNIDMIALLSNLAADSLLYLTEIGQKIKVPLIDDNILDIVPYDESGFVDVNSKKTISFKPFYTAIKEAFRCTAIIPSLDGYVAAGDAYWAFVPQIAELFSNLQLALLSKNETAKWVFTSFGRQDTRRKNEALTDYIDSITEVWLDEGKILKGWKVDSGTSYDGITPEFIESQPIEWLHLFYKWIAETKGRTELILTKPIFLNEDGKAVAAFDVKKQAILFLPTEGDSDYATINNSLLHNEETLAFIKQLGISEPSLRDEIYNIILPEYKKGGDIGTRPHFKKFFRYYQVCSQAEAKSILSLIKEYSFVLYKSKYDETQYRGIAEGLYFPFEPLQQWFQPKSETKFVCFDEYLQLVGEDKKEELISFLTDLGVKDTPRIISCELSLQEANEIKTDWPRSTGYQIWKENYIDGCKELVEITANERDFEKSCFVWTQLLKLVEYGLLNDNYWSQESVLCGKYKYYYYSERTEKFDSTEANRLRTQPWLANREGEFLSANELTVETLHLQYDLSSDEAVELIRLLGIREEVEETEEDKIDITSYAETLGLSDEEQRQALLEYAKRKKTAEVSDAEEEDEDLLDDEPEETTPDPSPTVKRVVKEILKRATSAQGRRIMQQDDDIEDAPIDEDDYSKPSVNISKKIEKVKEQAERDINAIARLEDLKQQAHAAEKYSYGWFKVLLELESINSGENNASSREVSISFSKVKLEEGTSRTLILKHPNRYIPQSMEDLADIPLELHFENHPMVKVAIEVVNVKSYTLRVKLRTNAQIEGVDLSLVKEARIVAKNPVFLLEELRKAFNKLGFEDDYDMKGNLCENIEFVFGPPGTGKTTHLAREVILPIMREVENLKVLVLTPTNKAADVLVRRIMEIKDADHSYCDWLVRFGATNDSIIEQSGVFRDKNFDIRTLSRNVTVSTIARFPYDYFLPDESTRLHLSELKWDYIIIDEASMIPLVNIVFPLYKKTPVKFIIAGDPFQIEPITSVDLWKNENIYTMVELKSFTEPTTVPHSYNVELLTTQYRSIPAIGEVFSRFAYDGVLKHNRTTESQRSLPIGDFIDIKPLNIIKFPISKYESIYRPKQLQSKSNYQVYSALFAFEFVKYLSSIVELMKDDKMFRIGLIAPYRAQSDLIDKLMAATTLPKNIDIQVGTIHGFQGDECDIIIALFNPPPFISTSKEMFLNKINIINVSISRARDYLFVIMPDDNTENVGNLTLIKKVERLFKEQPDWTEQQSPAIEELIFGSKSYLEDNSFSTSHQLINVYGKPEKRYEVRSEDNAVDVQIHE
ncbi:AAA domain-containing protein [Paenibacillus sp. FSL R5-0766]|uniref:AAA domain-containing protein n=1 Tax=unclassified Paenibacillus TaxID=185978 RepID=UPI00096E1E07|nr:AAA domain-containing protein [Paenibacillus sp. FSL R5-0765]OMF66375.1 DNA helicase [Paenibacillus sp. FSL R5-0765]